MDPAGAGVISAAVKASPLVAEYGTPVDRESAYEILTARAEKDAKALEEDAADDEGTGSESSASSQRKSSTAKEEGGFFEKPAVKSFLRSAGTVLGREITRSLFGTKRRR